MRSWTAPVGACLVLSASSASAAMAATESIEIQGFSIEYGSIGLDRLQRMQPSLERQIEIVQQSGVPAATLDYFRSVPVVVVAELLTGFGHAGRDEHGRQIVELKAAMLPADRPILLHELLHAYHGQKLGPTPMIRKSYQRAVQPARHQPEFIAFLAAQFGPHACK